MNKSVRSMRNRDQHLIQARAVQILHPLNQHRLRSTRRGCTARPHARNSQQQTAAEVKGVTEVKGIGQLMACAAMPPLQPSSHICKAQRFISFVCTRA